MLKRTLTGALILLVVALMIFSRSITIYFFDFFVMAITYVATYEVIKVALIKESRINLPKKNLSYVYLPLIYVYLCYLSYSLAKTSFSAIVYQMSAFAVLVLIAFIIDLVYLSKVRKEGLEIPTEHLLRGTKVSAKIMFYPITLLGTLYGFGINGMGLRFGTALIVTIFLVAMCTDVFAYVFGMTFHKGIFASQISPKKSISGAIGGIFGGLVASAGVFLVCQFALESNPFAIYPLWKVITFFCIVGTIGSFFVQIGDLVASAIKREVDIKDYGKIFPGHGGMMDRVDGLMFASVVVFIATQLIFII